jgi:hypothetical protein
MINNEILIAEKFRGPPKSGNGGYVSGAFAGALTGGVHNLPNHQAVEVTLRAPIPLDQSMSLHRLDSTMTVKRGETLIAEAKIVSLEMSVPTPATWEEAFAAREQSYSLPLRPHSMFEGIRKGVHPICFCCGAELSPTDGLHVYSAPVKDKTQVAAAWIPNACFANEGIVTPECIWTALDCPGQMAWRARGVKTGMLGRLTARIEKPVHAEERCVVIGWTMENEARKYFAGTALFNSRNELCAYAKAVWIGIQR